ncbi:GNAT family N-acetyltransferase [Neobacillus terrae]|uniref:GNAT family N-acetyltransferase n=1 Tax=Neobacillus terrae TaxID=3034837 RepID=UPI001409F4D1|nr:GNAT family N-acetyltransferase [Neobacillus terrae]NHM32088.1 GNAT family N-acetyltransferase [Neobacillus terrae]
MFSTADITIMKVTEEYAEEAKSLVLAGLGERFGFIDDSLNPDLYKIMDIYTRPGCLFLLGMKDNVVLCTGALSSKSSNIARIERMSVKKEYRRLGLAGRMMKELEQSAVSLGYRKIVLETNRNWTSAVYFYEKHGYLLDHFEDQCIHFSKDLY